MNEYMTDPVQKEAFLEVINNTLAMVIMRTKGDIRESEDCVALAKLRTAVTLADYRSISFDNAIRLIKAYKEKYKDLPIVQ